LPACLAAVQEARGAFTSMGWYSELIVVDNNSTDRTPDIAREHDALVVFEAENQISRARNRGAEAATGDWFLFLDADSFPSFDLFEDLAMAIDTGRVIGGGSTLLWDKVPYWDAQWMTKGWNLISRSMHYAAGSFVWCQADAFREVGGFSLELFATEEVDFSRRMKILAREKDRKWIILAKHPLITSGRKLFMFSRWDFIKLFLRFLKLGFKVIRSRDECDLWYKR